MNTIEKLKSLLQQDFFSKVEFETYKDDYLGDDSSNHLGMALVMNQLEKLFKSNATITRVQSKLDPCFKSFLQEKKELSTKPKKKRGVKKKKSMLPSALRNTAKTDNKYKKKQMEKIKALKGAIKRTPSQINAQKINEDLKKSNNARQITTRTSIWTVKKK